MHLNISWLYFNLMYTYSSYEYYSKYVATHNETNQNVFYEFKDHVLSFPTENDSRSSKLSVTVHRSVTQHSNRSSSMNWSVIFVEFTAP